MKTLSLSIKQKYFDEILAGTKKNEYREVRANNFAKYARYVLNGKEYKNPDDIPEKEDGDVTITPVKYDALKLITGAYNLPKRPYLIVKVKKAEVYILTDEKGEEIVYEHEGEEYLAAEIDYHLGEIIEKELYNKS